MNDEKNPLFRRPLGLLERYHATRNYLGFDTCVIVAAKYTPLKEPQYIDHHILFPALCRLLDREPALSFKIINERSRKPEFVRLNSIDLEKVVSFKMSHDLYTGTPDFLTMLMKEEFSRSFDTSSDLPLWRLTILYDYTIIFAWSHAIGDGTSGVAFHKGLLEALNATAAAGTYRGPLQDIWKLQKDNSPPLVRPAEKLTDLSVRWKTIFKEFGHILRPGAWERSRRSVWTGSHISSDTPRFHQNHVIIFPITPEVVSKLLSLCREKNATMTGALHALAIPCMAMLIQDQYEPNKEEPRFKKISTTVPVSLRNFTNTPITAMCDQVSAYQSDADLVLGFSWELASEYSRRLHNSVEGTKEVIGSLKYLFGRYESFLIGKLGAKRDVGLEISNLGPFKLTPSEKASSDSAFYKIQQMYFAQYDGVQGAAVKMNVAGDPDGGASICFTWVNDAVDSSFVQEFVRYYQNLLTQLVGMSVVPPPLDEYQALLRDMGIEE